MRPLPALALVSALALAACETPRESCINDASRQLRTVESLIRETQGNIDRGYALDRDQRVRVERRWCHVENEDGSDGRVRCDRTVVTPVTRPVAIDLNAEQAKLDSLLERRARLASESSARVQACVATYPE